MNIWGRVWGEFDNYLGYELRIDTNVRITNSLIREYTNTRIHEMRMNTKCEIFAKLFHCEKKLKA
jgi:hypothetical protein